MPVFKSSKENKKKPPRQRGGHKNALLQELFYLKPDFLLRGVT